ncbi:baseplate J/gp47 family protein [Aequorivita marisscotiae]|uniref:Baseplate J/gp47 family protein n=1 Tax=Aequorivita marisscotiae TaxID=3040348 RepID=A0ABY8KQS7_9FLAO|nr:baseplate J/gp47 family protein [Aequorivita sp. Ant34-E75]WGF91815.1 baseplate J/gp47 family protein [Aequorivita sp. Ant34-E75]
MAKDCENKFLINHMGTEQTQRSLNDILPENFNLNDFSEEEWMTFAYNFAKEVNYFSTENATVPTGNWESFFVEKEKISAFLAEAETTNQLSPHLALFMCFLKLMKISKTRFNALTKRHLDFYYNEILQIKKRNPVADSVHLIFELAKNFTNSKVDEHTLLEAGKDGTGKRLQYATNKEVVINNTKVGSIKSVYHHRKTINPNEIIGLFSAPVTNSADGTGEPFKDDPSWFPFGYPSFFKPETPLATPKLGFAIAAPTLNLAEGVRIVQSIFNLEKSIQVFNVQQIINCIDVYATGEKGWLGPFKVFESENGFTSAIGNKVVQLCVKIDKTEEPIVPYNKEIHQENFQTDQPVFRFLIKTKQPEFSAGYLLYTELLQKKVNKATVKVSVSEAEKLLLKNDFGNLVANKPFYPFGTQPMERSAFYIDYPEVFAKKWDNITINATWLNTPNDFKEHYIAYRRDENNFNLSPNLYFKTLYYNFNVGTKIYAKPAGLTYTPTANTSNLYVTGNDYFKAKIAVENNEDFINVNSAFSLFNKNGNIFEANLSLNNTNYTTGKNGPIKMSLNQPFLHALFPKVYALALTTEEDTVLPNEPYTPIIEKIELSYTASQEITFVVSETTNLEKIQLYQEHPFGQAATTNTLVPTYCAGGELYIGLANTQALQQVQLLFQLLEGTENPLTESFAANEKIVWAVLSNNSWMELSSEFLVGNTTDNFLKTGIVSITIPREATDNNTLLPSGLVWLRAKSTKPFDAVCKFINIHAQVITATFEDHDNELNHLKNGLPATTISKLTERNSAIKKVTQPYNSFGGQPEESDDSYYRRVSERIRHRDRAISLWDYEHLILEKFPEVYKVKCLNHTKDTDYHDPGNVTIVVIPDIQNSNAFDVFQPRLSTAKRNEIRDYINELNSFFISAEIINPNYEEVEVTLSVKFNVGFDENFYTKQLEEDIKKYLSPWAYSETSVLNFGVVFHKNKLISFLENQSYIDYLAHVIVKHRTSETAVYTEKSNIIPSNPKAILVSAKKHFVTAMQSNCKVQTPKNPTVCLP